MKKTNLLCLLLLFIVTLSLGCAKEKVTSIEFLNEPAQVYYTTDKLDDILKNIKLTVKMGKKSVTKALSDEDITITGFDLTTPGYHTLKVTYKEHDLEWTYLVKVPAWNNNIDSTWYKASESTFKLTTPEQLAGLAKLVNEGNSFKGKTILLENDIDLNNKPWTPISTIGKGKTGVNEIVFEGTFDGQNHTIENLSMLATHSKTGEHIKSEESYYNCGLFGYVKNATIKNLTIKNVNIMNGMMNNFVRSTQGTGALVGRSEGKTVISNVTITGSVMIKGEYKVGGLIGNLGGEEASISKVSVIGDANSTIFGSDKEYGDTNNYGGIIGYSDNTKLTIEGCLSNIKVSGYTSGGIIGCVTRGEATITNCAVYGETGDPEGSITGGIVGAVFSNAKLKNCYVLGKVSFGSLETNEYADAIVGKYGDENKKVTVESSYYASDKISDKVFNTYNGTAKKYSEILSLLPKDLTL